MREGEMSESGERVFAVTAALYRVTELLSREEPLRRDMRAEANKILVSYIGALNGVSENSDRIRPHTETLFGFLALAKTLPEVNPMNFAVLEREYRALTAVWPAESKIKSVRSPRAEWRGATPEKRSNPEDRHTGLDIETRGVTEQETEEMSERQKAILAHIGQVQQAKISDFLPLFSGISIKTIQRELQDLVAKNILRKQGEKRWTVYVRNNVL